jgi:hypothetical protein
VAATSTAWCDLPDGEWSKAQNLSGVVNTPYDEDGVFIHPNGRTMYFSSMGHNSMGGFDIFMTEMTGRWHLDPTGEPRATR